MRDRIETLFLDWQAKLPKKKQERVVYEDYDEGLQTIFVYRYEDFDHHLLVDLEILLQKEVDAKILVSSVVGVV